MIALLLPLVGAVVEARSAFAFGSSDKAWNDYYNNPSDTNTWGPFCAGGGAAVAVSALGVPACGPTGNANIYLKGGGPTPGFQCVELSDRFMWVKYGLPALQADGGQVAMTYASAYHKTLVSNGTAGAAPRVGDVMSFAALSDFSDDGHTGVVAASNVDSNGNGSIKLLSENIRSTGSLDPLAVKSWVVQTYSGFTHINWIAFGGVVTPPPPVQQAQTISFGALPDRVFGEAAFNVSATATSGLPVSFSAGPAGVCSIAGSTVSVGEIGTCTVTAKQAGNADWLAAPDVSRTFNVTKASTTTTVGADPPGEVEFATAVTFTANVSVNAPGSGTPTGTVDLTEGGRTLASGPVGGASFTTDRLAPGDHTITATYSGDQHFFGSSGSTTEKVTCSTTITKSVPGTITVKGTVCIEPGVTIGGYVNVQKGGALAINGATLRGGINAWQARAILVCGSSVRASLQAAATAGFVIVGDATGDCEGNAFRGGVEALSTAGFVSVAGNEVGGTTEVSWSRQDGGAPEIAGNRITGFLKCFSNDVAPTNDGQSNSVHANRQGQCKVPAF